MNRTLIAIATLMLAGPNAYAFEAIADVESVTPNTEIVNEPYQGCSTQYEQSTYQNPAPPVEDHSVAGVVAGAIAGGLVGSIFGEGNSKAAAAAAGAGLGAIAGSCMGSPSAPPPTYATIMTPVQRCRMVDHYDARATYTGCLNLKAPC
jgi:uncharacterized protein YcfJ